MPETLDMASALRPTVILLDLHMPGDGNPSQFAEQLHAASGHVIAMSLANDDGARALALEYGAVTLLDKSKLGSELIPTLLVASGASS